MLLKHKKARLWHRRLGHLNYQILHHMTKKMMTISIPKLPNVKFFCLGCQVSKQHREQFKNNQNKTTKSLIRIHPLKSFWSFSYFVIIKVTIFYYFH